MLYGLAASPFFVYCVGASGHREIETTTCADCVHPSSLDLADPAEHAGSHGWDHPDDHCNGCVDFSLTLSATGQRDPDDSSGMPWTLLAHPCPQAVSLIPGQPAAAAVPAGFMEPAPPAFVLPLSLRI